MTKIKSLVNLAKASTTQLKTYVEVLIKGKRKVIRHKGYVYISYLYQNKLIIPCVYTQDRLVQDITFPYLQIVYLTADEKKFYQSITFKILESFLSILNTLNV